MPPPPDHLFELVLFGLILFAAVIAFIQWKQRWRP